MDLCEILAEQNHHTRSERNHTYKLLLTFFVQYIDSITQNVILSRRCAFAICKKIQQIARDGEEEQR